MSLLKIPSPSKRNARAVGAGAIAQSERGPEALRLSTRRSLSSNNSIGDITLSVGVALFPDQGRTLEELFQAADAALYQAKRAGRDQVAVADPLRLITVPGRAPEKESEH